jgi:glycosyltransferase involved in cell wall biosynthesis
MAAGLPVVSSSASSMPEVLGRAGISFDPANAEEGAAAVCSVLSSEAAARSLSERGMARAATFTWDETGRKTVDGYRRVLGLGAARDRKSKENARAVGETGIL